MKSLPEILLATAFLFIATGCSKGSPVPMRADTHVEKIVIATVGDIVEIVPPVSGAQLFMPDLSPCGVRILERFKASFQLTRDGHCTAYWGVGVEDGAQQIPIQILSTDIKDIVVSFRKDAEPHSEQEGGFVVGIEGRPLRVDVEPTVGSASDAISCRLFSSDLSITDGSVWPRADGTDSNRDRRHWDGYIRGLSSGSATIVVGCGSLARIIPVRVERSLMTTKGE